MSVPKRFHALDATRGFALLLGIVLHATMSFFLPIPAADTSQSTTLAVSFYVIHLFRMSVFFLIAGFFAHLTFHRCGARSFIKDRAKRILLPMLAGWPILAPATIAAVVWGLSRSFPEGAPEAVGAAVGAAAAPEGLPLVHLWFLYYLCIFYLLALALRAGFVALADRNGTLRLRLDALLRTALTRRLAPLALAAPTFAVLHFHADWPLWFGIPTPDIGLAPRLPALVAYGTAFAFGWVIHRQTGLLDLLARQWRGYLVLAGGLTTVCLAIVGPMPSLADATTLGGGPGMRLAYAACYSLAIWCWTLGLVGMAMRFLSGESRVRRYLADSSYWLYLVHVPIVFGLQVLLSDVPLHWSVKLPAIVAVTLVLLLASYHFMVRPTLLGEVLNGRRYPRSSAAPSPVLGFPIAADPSNAHAAPVAELKRVTKRYGTTVALDGVDLAVRHGEILAVLGPNGAGKSTAIGLWLGILEPDEGEATVLGGSPFDVHSRLGVGVMMQEVALAPMLTTREHIELSASYYRDPLTVDETVALTGTATIADRRYAKLSGGQKRQVQFAAAVCGRPRVLFLDEPTVGLDIDARHALWSSIRRLRSEGCAIVLTTHYLEEAETLADRVAVLAAGSLVAEGSVGEMRALVTRRRIRCASSLSVEEIARWPGVVEAVREHDLVQLTASDAEAVVRRLLTADPDLSQLEVTQASLAEAFTELTREAA